MQDHHSNSETLLGEESSLVVEIPFWMIPDDDDSSTSRLICLPRRHNSSESAPLVCLGTTRGGFKSGKTRDGHCFDDTLEGRDARA